MSRQQWDSAPDEDFLNLFDSTRVLKRERLKHELAKEILAELESVASTKAVTESPKKEYFRVSITDDVSAQNKVEKEVREARRKKIVQIDDLPKPTIEEYLGFAANEHQEIEPVDVSDRGRRLFDGAVVEIYTVTEKIQHFVANLFAPSSNSAFEFVLFALLFVFFFAFRLGQLAGYRAATTERLLQPTHIAIASAT